MHHCSCKQCVSIFHFFTITFEFFLFRNSRGLRWDFPFGQFALSACPILIKLSPSSIGKRGKMTVGVGNDCVPVFGDACKPPESHSCCQLLNGTFDGGRLGCRDPCGQIKRWPAHSAQACAARCGRHCRAKLAENPRHRARRRRSHEPRLLGIYLVCGRWREDLAVWFSRWCLLSISAM